ILTLPCDVLVPAAMERVIDAKVAQQLKCRVLAEGANGPTTPDADLVLQKRQDEIFLIPDILCNSGGVVVSYFEWVQDLQQLSWGGRSDGAQTVLFTLDNMSLELMAPAGEGPAAERIREAMKISGEGLASICFRVDDIGKACRRLDRVALKPEPVAEAESRDL